MDGARRRDRRPAWLWLKRCVLCAREIEAWQTSEPAHIAEPVMAPFGDAMVAWQQSVEVSTRGRSMTFGPCGAAALASAAAGLGWRYSTQARGLESISRLGSCTAYAARSTGGVHKNIGFADPW